MSTISALPSAGAAGADSDLEVFTSNFTLSAPHESGRTVARIGATKARNEKSNAARFAFIGALMLLGRVRAAPGYSNDKAMRIHTGPLSATVRSGQPVYLPLDLGSIQ